MSNLLWGEELGNSPEHSALRTYCTRVNDYDDDRRAASPCGVGLHSARAGDTIYNMHRVRTCWYVRSPKDIPAAHHAGACAMANKGRCALI